MLQGRYAVVTGGAGFIGRHLVRELVARGAFVRVLDVRGEQGAFEPGVEFLRGSVLDPEAVDAALQGAEYLFHLAGNPHLWARDKDTFRRVNTEGTRIVLERAERVARATLRRVVVTSTEAVLVRPRAGAPERSAGPGAPSLERMAGPYCESKLLADRLARRAVQRGLPVVLVHPTVPIGPGDVNLTPPTRMLVGFLERRIRAYLECELNVVPVEDVAAGHILAAERGRTGEAYVLGGTTLRLSRLLAMLEEVSGVPMPRLQVPYWAAYAFSAVAEFLADHLWHVPPMAPLTGVRLARSERQLDDAVSRRELGYRTGSVRAALRRQVQWLHAQGLVTLPPARRRGTGRVPSSRAAGASAGFGRADEQRGRRRPPALRAG